MQAEHYSSCPNHGLNTESKSTLFSTVLHKTKHDALSDVRELDRSMGTLCQEKSSHSKWRFVGWLFSLCNSVLSMARSAIFLTYATIKHVGSPKFVSKLRDSPYSGCCEKCKIKLEKVYRSHCYYKELSNWLLFNGFYLQNDLPTRSSRDRCRKTLDMLYQSMAWGSIVVSQFSSPFSLVLSPLLV